MSINASLRELKKHLQNADALNTSISQKSIYWHIDHILMVIIGVLEGLHNSNPSDYRPQFNIMRSLVLLTGYIPRGKAPAPEAVIPKTDRPDIETLITKLHHALNALKEAEKFDNKTFFTHFSLGQFNKKQTLRFLSIHTHHHLKIIRDIKASL